MNGRLIVISAPSGTGKTTVIKHLLADMPEFVLSVSATTRRPRQTEKDGIDYHFVTEERFKEMIDKNEMVEWANVHDFFYGTPRKPIDAWIKSGKTIILDVDVQGGKNIKKIYNDAALFFLLPPSREELLRRLAVRGTNKGHDLEVRIKNADLEIAEKKHYDHYVVNDNVHEAVGEILKIIDCVSLRGTK